MKNILFMMLLISVCVMGCSKNKEVDVLSDGSTSYQPAAVSEKNDDADTVSDEKLDKDKSLDGAGSFSSSVSSDKTDELSGITMKEALYKDIKVYKASDIFKMFPSDYILTGSCKGGSFTQRVCKGNFNLNIDCTFGDGSDVMIDHYIIKEDDRDMCFSRCQTGDYVHISYDRTIKDDDLEYMLGHFSLLPDNFKGYSVIGEREEVKDNKDYKVYDICDGDESHMRHYYINRNTGLCEYIEQTIFDGSSVMFRFLPYDQSIVVPSWRDKAKPDEKNQMNSYLSDAIVFLFTGMTRTEFEHHVMAENKRAKEEEKEDEVLEEEKDEAEDESQSSVSSNGFLSDDDIVYYIIDSYKGKENDKEE